MQQEGKENEGKKRRKGKKERKGKERGRRRREEKGNQTSIVQWSDLDRLRTELHYERQVSSYLDFILRLGAV